MTYSSNQVLQIGIADLQAENLLLTEQYINVGSEITIVQTQLAGLTASYIGLSASIAYNAATIVTLQNFIQ